MLTVKTIGMYTVFTHKLASKYELVRTFTHKEGEESLFH